MGGELILGDVWLFFMDVLEKRLTEGCWNDDTQTLD